jgi:hypothetical protein
MAAAPNITATPTAAACRAGWIARTCWPCRSTRRFPATSNNTVNVLRLWSASATDEFDLGEFNAGSYTESVAAKNAAENITMVLYPNDASENGKALRLRQQYFLASASLQDVLEGWERTMAATSASSPRRTASSSTTPTRPARCRN